MRHREERVQRHGGEEGTIGPGTDTGGREERLVSLYFQKFVLTIMWESSGEGPEYSEFTPLGKLLQCARKEDGNWDSVVVEVELWRHLRDSQCY